MNIRFSDRASKEVTAQLNEVRKLGFRIALLPLGFASGHYDQFALRRVLKQGDEGFWILRKPSVVDTTYLISKSAAFIGTSLHGNIIAEAYGNPHLAIRYGDYTIPKLQKYLHTWEIGDLRTVVDVEHISKSLRAAVNIPRGLISDNSTRLRQLVYENFDRIFEVIEQE